MEGDISMAEIQDGSATFEVRSITDMYKQIQKLQQALTPITLPISNNYIFAQKIGNLVIISFDGFPKGANYPVGWGAKISSLDIGYKAHKKIMANLAAQSVVRGDDDGSIVAYINEGETVVYFIKFSGNGDKCDYWARGQIVIPVEE